MIQNLEELNNTFNEAFIIKLHQINVNIVENQI